MAVFGQLFTCLAKHFIVHLILNFQPFLEHNLKLSSRLTGCSERIDDVNPDLEVNAIASKMQIANVPIEAAARHSKPRINQN